ncbi:hypothetical protein BN873_p60012 [Candidatus Competibacter denitrificans Run_A_D11]|uniref:Uncharacterized protein n=1 Tax=Candidatus Competibacter denitrificans Run_A_D11 TaxID=1400863 RepID=W6MAG5_9GAMM|nr:hypothetical protein BN873_p60012 [Candidatus Competibacter denitrificans Run_A_D11]
MVPINGYLVQSVKFVSLLNHSLIGLMKKRVINDPAASCGVLGYQRTQQAAGNGPVEIQKASKVRSSSGLLVHVFGRLAAAMFMLVFPEIFRST